VEPDAAEIRVVACLVEKQRTTPDQYPLTLNSLRLACNQSTNRDPVVDYDESTVRSALERLTRRKWATLASWSTARSVKYKHLFDRALELSDPELAVLTVLMLRGAQTAGELRQRTERIHRFEEASELDATIARLAERGLCAGLDRRPGERGQRFRHLLAEEADGDDHGAAAGVSSAAPQPPPRVEPPADGLAERVARLEDELAALRDEVGRLRSALGG
jgi:uncharacterized protein